MNVEKLRLLIVLEKDNDPLNDIEWERIFEEKKVILCENLQETMQFIDGCTQEEFYWISNAFDDVSEKYQSQEFIDCLRRNQLRFPEIHDEIEQEIQFALSVMGK